MLLNITFKSKKEERYLWATYLKKQMLQEWKEQQARNTFSAAGIAIVKCFVIDMRGICDYKAF